MNSVLRRCSLRWLVAHSGLIALVAAIPTMADARGPHPDLDPNVWSFIRAQIEAAESATPVPASLTTAAIPKVMSSSRVEEDLGISIAIDGDTVVVGARRAFRDVVGDIAGAAYVFERDSTAVDPWRLVKRLVGSAIDDSDSFGTGVAISGDTIIIGAPNAAGGFGAVYVFYRDEGGTGNWGEVTAVTPVTANLYGGFGDAVALDGDVAIVGSPFDSGSATQAGSAFLLGRNQDGADSWGVITKISASDTGPYERFGDAVAISGGLAAVGCPEKGIYDGAAYVFERDYPSASVWGQRKKLALPSGDTDARFGSSVAVLGDLLLVGAPNADITAGDNLGAAYLYGQNQGGANAWGQIKEFVSGETEAFDGFGFSVALDGTTAAVSSWRDDDDGNEFGSVFIFNQDEGGSGAWGESAEIGGSESAALLRFGRALALDGDSLLVGGGGYDVDRYSGIVYVHERASGGPEAWGEVSILFDDQGNQFGRSVAIDGDTMVVGAWGARDACLDRLWCQSGAAYVFERLPEKNTAQPEAWSFVKRIIGSDTLAGDNFGWSVDVSGETIVVGARGASPTGGSSGAAYVFDRDFDPNDPGTPSPDNWGERAKLAGEGAGDAFGSSVAIDGDTVVVGAYAAASGDGRAYVAGRDVGGADNWGQAKVLVPPSSTGSDLFGSSVAIDGNTIAVGAPSYDYVLSDSGVVFVFDRDQGGPNNWGHAKTLAAADYKDWGELGQSVAISADTVVAGSYSEKLSAESDSGAAYVFERDQGGSGNWGQTRKLVAGDATANDEFGSDVGISWNTIVVGAMEDDDACPVDPTCESGSAYIFERDRGGAGMWGQSMKLTAFDASGLQRFGLSVAVERLIVGVGAPFDLDSCLGTDVCRPGAVYTYRLASDLVPLDFGDLPDSYNTTFAASGARHEIYPWVPRLGAVVDGEADGQPSAGADGDDVTGVDDEDGVTFLDPLEPGTTARVQVDVSAPALLGGWIDFNGNGVFDYPDDWLDGGTSQGIVLTAGSNLLDVSIPATAADDTETYARFRIASLEVGQDPNDPWYALPYELGDPMPDGEVEDYAVVIGGAPKTADCAIAKSNHQEGVTIGSSITYTIVVSNAGPDDVTGATVDDTLPVDLDTCSWTCVASGGASCTATPGSGDLSDTADLPAGASVTYTGECDVSASASGTLENTATLASPAGVADPNSANDTATDSDALSTDPPVSIEMFGEETGIKTVEAQETITVSNFVVKAGAVLTLRAGSEVILGDGVVVEDGAGLVIEIDPTLLP